MDSDSPPDLIDFYSIQNNDFNLIAFSEALDNWNESQRKRQISGSEGKPPGKKPYAPRIQKIKRDPKTSFWWSDYILDVNGVGSMITLKTEMGSFSGSGSLMIKVSFVMFSSISEQQTSGQKEQTRQVNLQSL